MISRLLVANRAEIASRVFRTCRALGIETVAVHSDADADLPYAAEADVAVRLPGNAPGETYLRADLIVDAARRTGADAIHPGYGFLSEKADFARAVIEAGITWVGPDPESIEQMGSKIGAKDLMRAAGVLVLEAPVEPTDADLPLLVKASAGGGGRGMRVVRSLDSLADEIAGAEAEAASAFGDGTVFVEPYVERGRHVEVQVVGDRQGNVLVLGERDCSVQRRHQKVVEESPAPNLPASVATALHDAARAAAEAIGYVGAGTVEFLYDAGSERFYFLEMNTRLQVEHPVTELVHGVDLVALQIAVAEGGALADLQTSSFVPRDGSSTNEASGHAIEVRLYAEDPAADWQPQSGLLTAFEIPEGDGLRVDAGFAAGNEVSTYYDAMLAKVIAWAPTRGEAARKLAGALSRARIHGVRTNRDLLVGILREPAFLEGDVSTAFFDDTDVLASTAAGEPHRHLLVAGALARAEAQKARRRTQRAIPVAWRNVVSQPQTTSFGDDVSVQWFGTRDGYTVDGLEVLAASPDRVVLADDGVESAYDCAVRDEVIEVDGPTGHATLSVQPRFVDPADVVASGSLLAPMPGTVISVAVEQGASVTAGQAVLVLEAMKMQHTVSAPTDGVLTSIDVKPGVQVAAGEVLAVVEENQ